jgi:hypothetical protein
MTKTAPDMKDIKEVLQISKLRSIVAIKLKNKAYITHILENPAFKAEFLLALNDFEVDFIAKAKLLLTNSSGKVTGFISNRRLDNILQTGNVRIAMSFYLLWAILKGIPIDYIKEARSTAQHKISQIFSMLRTSDSEERIEKAIIQTWMLPVLSNE